MENIQIFNYNNNPVSFRTGDSEVMINATSMARPFGKRPIDFLRLPSTNELIKAIVGKSHISENQLVRTMKGSSESGGGTWMHEDLAIDFAQWLSIDFRLWVNDRVKELLTSGITAINNRLLSAFAQRLEQLESNQETLMAVIKQNMEQEAACKEELAKQQKSKPAKTKTYTISEIADELGMTGRDLNLELAEEGILFNRAGVWTLNPCYLDKGFTRKRYFRNGFDDNGKPFYSHYLVWTEKGRIFILDLYDECQ